ncbi:hypothetical protein ACQ4M4_16095 [Leptolyngbya sp. AN02str]|uniref:hypothetical protein n=1 Tax=Leptolyngbya sp. AN02str TaxID=3423363 RepID=UPI003D321E44
MSSNLMRNDGQLWAVLAEQASRLGSNLIKLSQKDNKFWAQWLTNGLDRGEIDRGVGPGCDRTRIGLRRSHDRWDGCSVWAVKLRMGWKIGRNGVPGDRLIPQKTAQNFCRKIKR